MSHFIVLFFHSGLLSFTRILFALAYIFFQWVKYTWNDIACLFMEKQIWILHFERWLTKLLKCSLQPWYPDLSPSRRPERQRKGTFAPGLSLSLQGSGKKKDSGRKVVSLVIVVRSLTIFSSVFLASSKKTYILPRRPNCLLATSLIIAFNLHLTLKRFLLPSYFSA